MYALCLTSGDPPCVYGTCVRGECACWPLVEGEACEIGTVCVCTKMYCHIITYYVTICSSVNGCSILYVRSVPVSSYLQLLLMQATVVTSSACLGALATQPTTLASVFRPFMDSIVPTPQVRTDQHNALCYIYLPLQYKQPSLDRLHIH